MNPKQNLGLKMNENASLTISGQELFNSKVKSVYQNMVCKKQREQLERVIVILQQSDMILKPQLQSQWESLQKKKIPLSYSYDGLDSKEVHEQFEDLMEGKLAKLVESQDIEVGINKFIDTMKKQHVLNFAMHHELIAAIQTKKDIEQWQS